MRRAAYVLFITVLIVAAGFIVSYGIFPFFGPKTPVTTNSINIGFTSNNHSYEPTLYNFQRVAARVDAISFENNNKTGLNITYDTRIMYILGENLNENADAASWMFAIRHGNQTSVINFDRSGESIVDWPSEFPGQEIQMDQIILPQELFYRNKALIFNGDQDNITLSKELALTGNNYTLTLSGNDKKRILQFDAQSGALTSSND
jgi:hypothetical protein